MNVSNNNKEDAIGFAGLSSFITNSDDLSVTKKETNTRSQPEPSKEQELTKKTESSGTIVHNTPSQNSKTEKKEKKEKKKKKKKKSTKSSSSKPKNDPVNEPKDTGMSGFSKFLWFVVFIVIVIVWNQSETDRKNNENSNYTKSQNSTISNEYDTPQQYYNKKESSYRPSESKPSYGKKQVLNVSQIRYCRSEKIRLDAAETELDSYSTYDTTKFNNLVDDYNGRCGEFRYKRGNLQRAENDIKAFRSELILEGKARFKISKSNYSSSKTPNNVKNLTSEKKVVKKVKPKPNKKLLEVQKLLNILGYNAGVTDGLMGKNTRLAIYSFQDDNNINNSTIINNTLVKALKTEISNKIKVEKVPVYIPIKKKTKPIHNSYLAVDHKNLKTCLSGKYIHSCKHEILTREQARQVDIAEKRENYKTCIKGKYIHSCKHEILTREQARQVDIAEKRENYKTCIKGKYIHSCKHEILTRKQKIRVRAAELREGN